MKIKQLDNGFKGIRTKNSPKSSPVNSPDVPAQDNEQTPEAHDTVSSAVHQSKGTTLKEALTPQYVGYVESALVPVLERMGYTGDRLDIKKVNNINRLYSEVINSKPGNDMASAYAYLAVLLSWHGATPNPNAMDEMSKPKEEVKPSQRAYYKERLSICSTCPEAYETMGRIRCGKCKCFMELKAYIKASQCPLKKW